MGAISNVQHILYRGGIRGAHRRDGSGDRSDEELASV
jgi:hypothetical protein